MKIKNYGLIEKEILDKTPKQDPFEKERKKKKNVQLAELDKISIKSTNY